MIKYAFESRNKNNQQKISVEARLAGGGGERGGHDQVWADLPSVGEVVPNPLET